MDKLPEARLPQEFILDAFADPSSVRDVVRGKCPSPLPKPTFPPPPPYLDRTMFPMQPCAHAHPPTASPMA